jgi:hypothetical protein
MTSRQHDQDEDGNLVSEGAATGGAASPNPTGDDTPPGLDCPGEHLRDAEDPEDRRDADGKLVCGHDKEPIYYCTAVEDYFHVEDSVRCFLIPGGHPQ